nr:TonB family protein [uncultured Sphingomonas sp.]
MLAYAPDRRTRGALGRSPQTMSFVVIGHILLVGVALTTKMTMDRFTPQGGTDVTFLPSPPPPEIVPAKEKPQHKAPAQSTIDHVVPLIPARPADDGIRVDPGPTIPSGPVAGESVEPIQPKLIEPPRSAPVRMAAVFNTPDSLVRPPYPTAKLRAGEETTLRLKLTIDANGRVTAVDPVGQADAAFLAAARKHIMRSWRYRPATVDGVASGSTTVINLSFRLEDA